MGSTRRAELDRLNAEKEAIERQEAEINKDARFRKFVNSVGNWLRFFAQTNLPDRVQADRFIARLKQNGELLDENVSGVDTAMWKAGRRLHAQLKAEADVIVEPYRAREARWVENVGTASSEYYGLEKGRDMNRQAMQRARSEFAAKKAEFVDAGQDLIDKKKRLEEKKSEFAATKAQFADAGQDVVRRKKRRLVRPRFDDEITLKPALPSVAISKVRDIRRDSEADGLYVVFCARESPNVTGFPGHAYVVLGRDDEINKLCVIDAFGFQPANEGDSGIVKAVPGNVVEPYVKDYDKPLPGVCRLILKVDRSQYDSVDAIRKKWSDREYRLSGPNCIDFVDDAAKALNLSRPYRSVTQRPHSYVHRLTEQN